MLTVWGGHSPHWLAELSNPWGWLQVHSAVPARSRPQSAGPPGQGPGWQYISASEEECDADTADELWGRDFESVQTFDLSGE